MTRRLLRSVRRVLSQLNRADERVKPARSACPYATHVPVLVGLASTFPVRSVLECGSGHFSTATFLDRSVYRQLHSLVTLENDATWLGEIRQALGGDGRLEMMAVDGPMWQVVGRVANRTYDLVLIDDSTDARSRAATIRAVVPNISERTLVVIHDFEVREYQEAASCFHRRVVFDAFNPWTAVLWNGSAELTRPLERLKRRVKKLARSIPPDDRDGWRVALGVQNPLVRRSGGESAQPQ